MVSVIKCPRCGADATGQTRCSRCGQVIDIPSQKIEVEYKDFKISEFLEIRPKKPQTPGNEAGNSVSGELKAGPYGDTVDGRRTPQGIRTSPAAFTRGVAKRKQRREAPSDNPFWLNMKNPFFITMAVVLFVMLIAALFFLRRF